jgi:hypothetical protein
MTIWAFAHCVEDLALSSSSRIAFDKAVFHGLSGARLIGAAQYRLVRAAGIAPVALRIA